MTFSIFNLLPIPAMGRGTAKRWRGYVHRTVLRISDQALEAPP
jgi:hypothetical protein